MKNEKIFTTQDIKDFIVNSKLPPTELENLTINKFLHICRIMYDANKKRGYYDYDDNMTDEQVYCCRKWIGEESTAWFWCSENEAAFSKDSLKDMEAALYMKSGYHFEELEFGGLCHCTGWNPKSQKGPIMTVWMEGWKWDLERRQRLMIAFNALAERGIILDLMDREAYLMDAKRDLEAMMKQLPKED